MTHIVAISPHLDDAAFSVGGFLASRARAGDRVTIVTCFTGNVERPQGFALACQLDKGLSPEVDYMALRRDEDLAACASIGADAVHLPFLEAPHRGYASAPELFATRRPGDRIGDDLGGALATLLDRLSPDLLLGPLAIGDHVDHWIVRDAMAAIARPHRLWEDWPYADRLQPGDRPPADTTFVLEDADHDAKRVMCAAYRSQLGFQFGGPEKLETRLRGIAAERMVDAPDHAMLSLRG